MRLSFNYIRTAGMVLLSPIIFLVALILIVDFGEMVLQLITGDYSTNLGQSLGFYLVMIPSMLFAVGVRQIRRLL